MTADEYLKNADAAAQQMTGYTASSDVTAAAQKLSDVNAGKPSEYTSADADRLGSLYEQIMNQGQFSYNPGTDAVYQQAKQNYQQTGQQAAQDTQNQADAMSGGYGNTWSQSVGAQQYGEYLKGINDILPSLEQNAYTAYSSENDRLSNLYNLAQTRDDTAYNRYRDQVSDWQADRTFAQEAENSAYTRDYQAYSDRLNAANTAAGFVTEDNTNAQSENYSWALTLIQQGIMPTDDVLQQAGISSADALKIAKKYGYGSGSSSGGSSGSSSGSGGTAATDAGKDGPYTMADMINIGNTGQFIKQVTGDKNGPNYKKTKNTISRS